MRYDEATKQRARDLRRQGLSVSQIAASLDVQSTSVVQRWVRDLPSPDWTGRPRAKDALRHEARRLRSDGESVRAIASRLGVARSSVSTWVRDLPIPDGLRERAAHASRINGERWVRTQARRAIERMAVKDEAAALVGNLSDRDLLLLGAAVYWAEGTKDKPYARRELVTFVNSDPGLVLLFLRWLRLMQVEDASLRLRVAIHETADIDAAHRYWSDVTGRPLTAFSRPTIKRHRPQTVRHNTGPDYHGCLVMSVLQSRVLYQQIDGVMRGIVACLSGSRTPGSAEPDALP